MDEDVIHRHFSDFPDGRLTGLSFDQVIATMPTKRWINDAFDKEKKDLYTDIQNILRSFIANMSGGKMTPMHKAQDAVKKLCHSLNELKREGSEIETTERKELLVFIFHTLRVRTGGHIFVTLERYRNW